MPAIQRYLIVALCAAFWGIASLILLMLYAWVGGTIGGAPEVLIRAALAAVLGACFGLMCSITSYVKPLSGSWFQRAAIGMLIGLLVTTFAQEFKHSLKPNSVLWVLAHTSSSLPTWVALFALFGLVTPRRFFFAIAK